MLQAQPPEEAFEQSRAKLLELTGRTAPDLVVIASGMWCVQLSTCSFPRQPHPRTTAIPDSHANSPHTHPRCWLTNGQLCVRIDTSSSDASALLPAYVALCHATRLSHCTESRDTPRRHQRACRQLISSTLIVGLAV
jgi:hypothetical protein